MKSKLISILAALCCYGYAADSQVDVRIDTDPNNLQNRSSFNITTTTSQEFGTDHALLFTPEMTFYNDGSVDFSIGAGHRHNWKGLAFGHHVFFDRSTVGALCLDQVGTGVDVLSDRVDFRANYYHPCTKATDGGFFTVKSCRWADAEFFFKTPYFGVGTGPLYNLDFKNWAIHSRLVVPLRDCSVSVGAIAGQGGYGQALLSVSFHLFKPKSKGNLTAPSCHVQKSNIYYNFGYMMTTPPDGENIDAGLISYIDNTEAEITHQEKTRGSK